MTPIRVPQLLRLGGSVIGFFGLKIVVGLLLVAASAHRLSVTQFVTFSQLFLCLALLSTVSAGAVQGGLTRQIAVADGDPTAERKAAAAALAIWAGFATVLLVAVTLFGASLSTLLIGEPRLSRPLLLVTLAAVIGGVGSILGAILTGRGRASLSLWLQAVGLVVSGGACYARLVAGDPVGAVLAFTAGPIATTVLALLVTHDVLPRPGRAMEGVSAEIRLLLAYSAAGLSIAVLMPATLFGLRSVYRTEFGAEQLGYWLAANRVSDVTSQLLGIYMGQIFLPRMAQSTATGPARRLALQTLALGTAAMAAGWLVFAVGSSFFVSTFFSARFLPAVPFINGYLLGDALRVSASMASATAAARGRPWLCIGIEATVAVLVAAWVLVLTALGRADAPWLGYLLAQATMSVLVGFGMNRLLRSGERRDGDAFGERPVRVQGSEAK